MLYTLILHVELLDVDWAEILKATGWRYIILSYTNHATTTGSPKIWEIFKNSLLTDQTLPVLTDRYINLDICSLKESSGDLYWESGGGRKVAAGTMGGEETRAGEEGGGAAVIWIWSGRHGSNLARGYGGWGPGGERRQRVLAVAWRLMGRGFGERGEAGGGGGLARGGWGWRWRGWAARPSETGRKWRGLAA